MPHCALVDTAVEIETPEDVRLSFRLAGPGARSAAYLADLVVRLVMLWFVLLGVVVVAPFARVAGASWGLLLLAFFVLEWGYGTLFEGLWGGRTPGKRLFGLRVVREDGHGVDFHDALVRNLLRAADVLPSFYAAGLVCMSVTARMQRVGDLAAGTMVVHEARETLRRESPDLAGAARLGVGELGASWRPAERTLDLLHSFALRRDGLQPERAREIALVLAEPLARRLSPADDGWRSQPDVFLLRVLRTFQARA